MNTAIPSLVCAFLSCTPASTVSTPILDPYLLSDPEAGTAPDDSTAPPGVPSNIVTSGEPEVRTDTKEPQTKSAPRRNPDYDTSGNVVLDLGTAINDMVVVGNNVVVVSPEPQTGRMYFIHIAPGAGLKGVKVTDTFAWSADAPDNLSRRLLRPCLVVFDKKRFGDSADGAVGTEHSESQDSGYLRIVIHCPSGAAFTKDGKLTQALDIVTPAPNSLEGANPNMSNPTIRVPVQIDEHDGHLVARSEHAEILSDLSPENAGLFNGKIVTAAGITGLRRSVVVGRVKVEVDKDHKTRLVISDPDSPPAP